MKKILLLQGANLNYLGIREPEIYDTTTPDQLNESLYAHAKQHGYEIDIPSQLPTL
jgi:3-dehydroquinate dehydratase II